jgi:DNA-binding LacI/PurR family transcriptional regulator
MALREASVMPHADWVIEGDWSARSGYEALMALAARGDLPDAIFAQNDQMAVGVLRAATDLGVPVPDQLSVIGVDDIPMAAYFVPPLTTVRQDFLRIGQEAARLLIRALNHPTAPRQHLRLPAELIVRRSTSAS